MRCAVLITVVLLAATAADGAVAAPQRLDCILSDTDTPSGVKRREISIVFDEQPATMRLEEGRSARSLKDVSISMTSMSGGDEDTTVAVSRSSLRVVLQTYRASSVETEYGVCTVSSRQPTSATQTPVP